MKTNKEIIDYLNPYTEIKGYFQDSAVEYVIINNMVYVTVDNVIVFKDKETKTRITSYLRRNNFKYIATGTYTGYYVR